MLYSRERYTFFANENVSDTFSIAFAAICPAILNAPCYRDLFVMRLSRVRKHTLYSRTQTQKRGSTTQHKQTHNRTVRAVCCTCRSRDKFMVRFTRFYKINGRRILFDVFVVTLTLKGRLFCLHLSTFSNRLRNRAKHVMIADKSARIWPQSYTHFISWLCLQFETVN